MSIFNFIKSNNETQNISIKTMNKYNSTIPDRIKYIKSIILKSGLDSVIDFNDTKEDFLLNITDNEIKFDIRNIVNKGIYDI